MEDSLARHWLAEIESAQKEFKRWEDTAGRVVRRYRDERDAINSKQRRFNILWSNLQVLKPALYGRMPQPEVSRRFKDGDPVGRTASLMLERCLEYEVEQYPDFHRGLKNAVEDRLLPGRGVAWIRYEPEIAQVSEDVEERLAYECAPVDYVHWKDFLHEPARVWEEVTWVARRVWMTTAEGQKRFGDVFLGAPMGEEKSKDTEKAGTKKKNKVEVWEIWDKVSRQAIWVAIGLDRELDARDDPLGLEMFFPCPMPLFSTVTTGSLIPVPDYCQYQDQAEEIDTLTQRISRLVKALKVVGVYNAEYPAIKRMLDEGVDNTLVPVDAWAAFAEKGGLKGAVEFMQLKDVIDTLVRLYENREVAKQMIYEIIGISDIMRGSTKAEETLGSQQLKTQFGSMRLKQPQEDVARFASDLLRMKAHIICKFYSDETILRMSGIEHTADAPLVPQALALLRAGPIRDFRIQVSADTLAQIDESQERAERIEFITAVGRYLEKALPVMQAAPTAGALLGEVLMYLIRGFGVGKTLEAAFEKALAQIGESGNPQAQAQQEQLRQQAQELQQRETKLQLDEIQFNANKQVGNMELEGAKKQLEVDRQLWEGERKAMTLEQATAVVKEHEARAQEALSAPGVVEVLANEVRGNSQQVSQAVNQAVAQNGQQVQQAIAGLGELMKAILGSDREIVRDASGRATRVRLVKRAA